MGQQQILLLVLALIIVGAAIVIGMKLFGANAVLANRDSIFSELNNLTAVAMQYYKKPPMMGGGDNSFTGWEIPAGLDSTVYATYTENPSDQLLTISAVGREIGDDGMNYVKIVATITSDNFSTEVLN